MIHYTGLVILLDYVIGIAQNQFRTCHGGWWFSHVWKTRLQVVRLFQRLFQIRLFGYTSFSPLKHGWYIKSARFSHLKTIFLVEWAEISQNLCFSKTSSNLVFRKIHLFFASLLHNFQLQQALAFWNITKQRLTYFFCWWSSKIRLLITKIKAWRCLNYCKILSIFL